MRCVRSSIYSRPRGLCPSIYVGKYFRVSCSNATQLSLIKPIENESQKHRVQSCALVEQHHHFLIRMLTLQLLLSGGVESNHRPPAYEADELPDCSTALCIYYTLNFKNSLVFIKKYFYFFVFPMGFKPKTHSLAYTLYYYSHYEMLQSGLSLHYFKWIAYSLYSTLLI